MDAMPRSLPALSLPSALSTHRLSTTEHLSDIELWPRPKADHGTLPEIGSAYNFANSELQGLRMLPLRNFKKYLIFYRLNGEEDITEIVRVVHSARDLPTLFGASVAEKEEGEEQKAA